MKRIEVSVANDHLEDLARKGAVAGVIELVWNSLDAEANNVRVRIVRNELEGIDEVEIIDDGHGMTPDEAEQAFGSLGGSWKRQGAPSRNRRRRLHGSHGRGRFIGFAIGGFLRWETVAETNRLRELTVITGAPDQRRVFIIDDPVATDAEIGTRVVVSNVPPESASALLRDEAIDRLTVRFAIYLAANPDVTLVYDGTTIDPVRLQELKTSYPIAVPVLDEAAELIVIEWKRDVGSELVLCDESGIALWHMRGLNVPGFHHTAYLCWAGFRRHEAELDLLNENPHPLFQPLLDAAHQELKHHFDRRGVDVQNTVIEQWKEEQVYPFAGEPATPLERVERDIFDVVAATASRAVNSSRERQARRFSLRLLKEAIEQSPTALRRVLKEVLELSDEKLADLDSVIQRTSLSSLVSLGKLVSNRLEMIEALDILVFDREVKTTVLERQHLHRILEKEPWIFGEEWALALSERTLTSVLHEHLAHLDRTEFEGSPVVRADGTTGRVDMLFSLATPMPTQQRRHLVVELKRPSLKLGLAEYAQVLEYADAVVSDRRFDTSDVHWSFWLVGTDIDRPLRGQAAQRGRDPGLASAGENGRYEVWVKTWAELLDGARHRLKFIREELAYQSTDETALATLRRVHNRFLPPELREG